MKYFMSVYSPSRESRRVFLMTSISAEHYYDEYCRKLSQVEKTRQFETGETMRPPSGDWHPDVYIWGEDISDREIFKRLLTGSVDKEMLES